MLRLFVQRTGRNERHAMRCCEVARCEMTGLFVKGTARDGLQRGAMLLLAMTREIAIPKMQRIRAVR
jgi:hypothetical protein